MQADGLNLEAIRRLLESGDGSVTEMFDFSRAIRAPFEDETPEIERPGDRQLWGTGGASIPI